MSDAAADAPRGARPFAPGLAAPASLRELFVAFTVLALQGFGGVLPVAQRELVEKHRWLTREQFVEMLAVSQVLPGPNVVNLALMFGDRCFGWRGAVMAFAGMMAVPTLIVLGLTALYAEYAHVPVVAGALRGMGAVAAGLVLSTALKLASTLRTNRMGAWIGGAFALLTFVAIAWLHVPLVWIVLGLGVLAIAVAWSRMKAP
jgi:chromate transporter